MGADTKALRTRIKSVDSTLHLTKAMGLVASSKIRGASDAMNKSRQYSSAVRSVVELLLSSRECRKSPYVKGNTTGKDRIIIIAGDRGLAGGYNANVFRLAKTFENAEFIPIGKRACERFSVMTQETQISWILPLTTEKEVSNNGTVFEPDELTILNTAVPEYLNGKLMGFVRESYASEVAARRMAMDSAGKNAQAMIDDLRLEYNRARQGAITQEITEIVAGSGT